MLFNSFEFIAFLFAVLGLYYLLPPRLQNILLLAASYLFYAYWDYRFLPLILAATLLDFYCGKFIAAAGDPKRRKLWLALSLAGDLGILAFFKYFNFFMENASRVLNVLGLQANPHTLYIILPLGISFYTFRNLTYTIDIYRGRMQPTDKFLDFALFVAFFPQLIAGPIERASRFLPQISKPRHVTAEQIKTGVALIALGFFRKVAIADPLSVYIDPVFGRPDLFSTPELLRAALFYSLQIYCDFAGYSDIARGIGRLLGIELVTNFRQPYLSPNISEFWRRWHISLSTWLRDYLYIPLGGNRKGRLRTYANLMITMLLGGLWHGASWNFVIWGGILGFGLSAHKALIGDKRSIKPITPGTASAIMLNLAGVLGTFALISFTWIFFRSAGTQAAFVYVSRLLSMTDLRQLPAILPSILCPWLVAMTLDWFQDRSQDHTFFVKWSPLARGAVYAIIVVAILVGSGSRAPFIYSQF